MTLAPARRAPTTSAGSRAALLAPMLVGTLDALAFWVVRPGVGDLQAALARQHAASHGVGLSYWFAWFGGGSTPGTYSVLTPYLSTLVGAPLLAALAAVATTPLAYEALSGTRHRVAGTWVATGCAACDLWSGRVPFALGTAAALVVVIGVRRGRTVPLVGATVAAVAASACSPVSGAFLVLALAAVVLLDRSRRPGALVAASAAGATLLAVAAVFGSPGDQTYNFGSLVLTLGATLALLLARPSAAVRLVLWLTLAAALVLWLVPNGLGSNVVRLPWIWLPAAVFATAQTGPVRRNIAVLPALALCVNATAVDLGKATRASSSTAYYATLIDQLRDVGGLRNERVEVVDELSVHTASLALLGHAMLAGGYESQTQNAMHHVLVDSDLDAARYRRWLDDNAVGYVALDRQAHASAPEYRLVHGARPGYLVPVSSDARWALYRVRDARPVVAAPQRVVAARQADMTIDVPCACTFRVRVRYSRFLHAAPLHGRAATVSDDGHGWTQVRTYAPGRYTLRGELLP